MTPPKRRTSGERDTRIVPLPTHDGYTPPTPIDQPSPRWWSRLAWPVAIVGLFVFVIGWVGAQTGAIAIPFDPHPARSQFVGFGLMFLGLRLGSGRHDKQ